MFYLTWMFLHRLLIHAHCKASFNEVQVWRGKQASSRTFFAFVVNINYDETCLKKKDLVIPVLSRINSNNFLSQNFKISFLVRF